MSLTISIHEVAKTSTGLTSYSLTTIPYFNPRGRKDLDKAVIQYLGAVRYFNPRGRKDLDIIEEAYKERDEHFNPRGRKDLDRAYWIDPYLMSVFQSTRSQRPRHETDNQSILGKIFQSTRSQRPRLAGTPILEHNCEISIHEVAKTSTLALCHRYTYTQHFNPRGRKDLDTPNIINQHFTYISIHEVAKTSTSTCSIRRKNNENFNPRGRKDLDRRNLRWKNYRKYFNPRGRKDLDVNFFNGSSIISAFQSTRSQRPRQQIPPKTKSPPLQNLYLLYNHPTIISTK